jgi:hypothetical protein
MALFLGLLSSNSNFTARIDSVEFYLQTSTAGQELPDCCIVWDRQEDIERKAGVQITTPLHCTYFCKPGIYCISPGLPHGHAPTFSFVLMMEQGCWAGEAWESSGRSSFFCVLGLLDGHARVVWVTEYLTENRCQIVRMEEATGHKSLYTAPYTKYIFLL